MAWDERIQRCFAQYVEVQVCHKSQIEAFNFTALWTNQNPL